MTKPERQTTNDAVHKRRGIFVFTFAFAGFFISVSGLITLVASGIGYRLGWWSVPTALQISEWAAYAAALGLVLSLAGAILSRPSVRQRVFVLSLLGLAASLPVAVLAVQWQYATQTYPPINDISTDIEDPPIFWDMPNPTDYPGAESAALQRAAYPDLVSLELAITSDQAYALAMVLVQDKGWEIIANDPEEGRIEAVSSTFLYGFKDEVIIRILPSDSGAKVDVRSRSRMGRIDRGVNAKRIRAILAAMKARADSFKQ